MPVEQDQPSFTPTLLYDGECSLCSLFARLMVLAGLGWHVRVLPFQEPKARQLLLGWPREAVERSSHLVTADGSIFSGPAAFSRAVDHLPFVGKPHSHLPSGSLIRRLEEAFYRLGEAMRNRAECGIPD